MLSRSDLPDDAAEWGSVAVSLPRLNPDSSEQCPYSEDDVFDYVQTESGDTDRADRQRFVFLRTAQVANTRYWLWEYTESDGERVFVTCSVDGEGSTCLGLAEPNGLSDAQFLLADYYDEIYWS